MNFFSSSLSLSNNNNSCFFAGGSGIGRSSFENLEDDVTTNGGTANAYNISNCHSGVHFGHLWTPNVRANLQQAFRFSEKILAATAASHGKLCGRSTLTERSFQEIFQEIYLNLQKTLSTERFLEFFLIIFF